ncbi:MAG: IS110 family transposase [Anaerolineales bacterium]
MQTRIIGIDLAISAAHKAVVLDKASNTFISPLIPFYTDPADLDRLLAIARSGTGGDVQIMAVLEATGMAWFPVSVYLQNKGVLVYRVSGQQVADQRRVYQRHAKTDRIDARVLARLPLTLSERLYPLFLPTAPQLALQRACREVIRLTQQKTAIRLRLQATDRLVWLDLSHVMKGDSPQMRWVRQHWYDPWRVLDAGEAVLTRSWLDSCDGEPGNLDWIPVLVRQAQRVADLYGSRDCIPCAAIQASALREQARLEELESQIHFLRLHTVRPLYRQLHPHRYLETIPGIGQDSAAVYIAFIGDIRRFPSLREFQGWAGMIPYSKQSGNARVSGLHITQAGPDLIKATAYLNAQVARLRDPQIAAVYHRSLMTMGKHFSQAICACASHLLDRVYMVLRDDRPYEIRDVDGTPVSKKEAHRICQTRYRVPESVRRRTTVRVRKARREACLERRAEPRA